MNEMELEKILTKQFDMLPPDDFMVKDITPWKRSMKYILCGLFLMLMDIDVFDIDTSVFIQMSGYICILLGFRSIRCENIFFKIGYIGAIVLNIGNMICVLLDISIWRESIWIPAIELQFIISFVIHMFVYVCVWLGVWNIENKVGTGKHSKCTILLPVSYGIMAILAIMEATGIIAIVWLILYICLLIALYKVYKSLESTGYVINASYIKIPNWIITTSVIAVIIIGAWVVSSFNKYPMKWEQYAVVQTVELEGMKQQLMQQGIPEYVLEDLPPEDIEQCAGASVVVVDDNEVINSNIGMDAKYLKLMSYAFCIDEESGRWKIVHYFLWEGAPSFYGTEVISYDSNDIINAENISGYVIYDEEDATYRAPYYRMDYVDCVEPIMGMVYTELFTEFSFDREGSNYRGYITYEIASKMTISITMDYFHQNWRINYPAQTAWDYVVSNVMMGSDGWEKYSKIGNTMQFRTWKEDNELDIEQP